jgi:predicted DCC family thiol-disulfide oxidoreductase YuxK
MTRRALSTSPCAEGPLFPQFFRDGVYDVVADNRYDLLGIKDECRLGRA